MTETLEILAKLLIMAGGGVVLAFAIVIIVYMIDDKDGDE